MPRRRLIERREQLGMTQADVARAAGCAEVTYRRYETGERTPRPAGRKPLAQAMQWTTLQLAVALAEDRTPVNGHSVPHWLGHLASLEQAAARLCAVEVVGVHGLLQTPGYATAVEEAEGTRSTEAVARRVDNRLARQAVLSRDVAPLDLSVILDESVLHRVAGGPEVMADQLEHLVDATGHPNVDLRVLPFDAGLFPFGSFALVFSPGAAEPYMAITEDRGGPHYLDRDHELRAHIDLYAHVSQVALDPDETVDLIMTAAKEYQ